MAVRLLTPAAGECQPHEVRLRERPRVIPSRPSWPAPVPRRRQLGTACCTVTPSRGPTLPGDLPSSSHARGGCIACLNDGSECRDSEGAASFARWSATGRSWCRA